MRAELWTLNSVLAIGQTTKAPRLYFYYLSLGKRTKFKIFECNICSNYNFFIGIYADKLYNNKVGTHGSRRTQLSHKIVNRYFYFPERFKSKASPRVACRSLDIH